MCTSTKFDLGFGMSSRQPSPSIVSGSWRSLQCVFYYGTCNMFLAYNATNFDGKFVSTSPIGEVGGVSPLALSTHEAKPRWLKLITPTMFCFLLQQMWNMLTPFQSTLG